MVRIATCLFYDVDDYYLSNGEKYQREHFNDDTCIYEYTDDSFVLAYTGEQLKWLVIPNQEKVDSLFSKEARKNLDQRRLFSSFMPVIGKNVKSDVGLIRNAITEFYEPDEEENPDEEL